MSERKKIDVQCFMTFFFLLAKGMGIIEQLDPMSFTNYLKKYRNTICGRHPIGVLLNVSTTEDKVTSCIDIWQCVDMLKVC